MLEYLCNTLWLSDNVLHLSLNLVDYLLVPFDELKKVPFIMILLTSLRLSGKFPLKSCCPIQFLSNKHFFLFRACALSSQSVGQRWSRSSIRRSERIVRQFGHGSRLQRVGTSHFVSIQLEDIVSNGGHIPELFPTVHLFAGRIAGQSEDDEQVWHTRNIGQSHGRRSQ